MPQRSLPRAPAPSLCISPAIRASRYFSHFVCRWCKKLDFGDALFLELLLTLCGRGSTWPLEITFHRNRPEDWALDTTSGGDTLRVFRVSWLNRWQTSGISWSSSRSRWWSWCWFRCLHRNWLVRWNWCWSRWRFMCWSRFWSRWWSRWWCMCRHRNWLAGWERKPYAWLAGWFWRWYRYRNIAASLHRCRLLNASKAV